MSAHHRINAIDDVVISSKNSGHLVINPDVTFSHADASFLADLKGLKGTLVNGDLVKFDGSNLVAKASSDFASASALSDYLTTADASAGYVAKSELDTSVSGQGYIKGTDQYVQSVGSNLSVTGSQLNVDLSALQVAANLDADVGTAGYIKAAGQYVRSVGANLAVDGSGELTVDLSSVENPDLSGYLQTASLQTEISNLATLNVPAVQQGAVWSKNKTQAYTGSATECLAIACANDKVYKLKVQAVYNNDDHTAFGAIAYEALWKRISGTASLVASSDSFSAMGACDGSELSFVDSSGNISVRIKGSASGGVGAAGAANVQVSAQEC